MRVSSRLKGMSPYNPGGKPCKVVLNANESFVPPSEGLRQDFERVLADCAFNRYPDPRAAELCQAFADFYKVDWEKVTASNGSDEMIDLLFACLIEPGDKVLTVRPDFSMYSHGAYMNGVQEVVYEKEDYRIKVDSLLSLAQKEDVAMILFSNPCNPTGIALSRAEVIQIIDGFDGIVVVDEAYMDFGDDSVLDLVESRQNLIVLKTCSKALAMASLRLGFAVAPTDLTTLLRVGKAPYNVGRLVQSLGSCVLRRQDEIREAIASIKASTQALGEGLKRLAASSEMIQAVLPSAANYYYVVTDQAETIYEKLQDHDVLVRSYAAVGGLRICAGNAEENEACLKALEAILEEIG